MKTLRHLLLPLLVSVAAADPITISVKPPVLPDGVRMERDLAYLVDGDQAQRLDLYLPEKAPAHPLPLVVHIHGGAWMAGNKFPCPVVEMVTEGYVVASVGYRFSQKAKFPAQIQDCQAAIRWLRANREKYHLDPEKIGVVGGSAGGHLASLVGTAGGTGAFPLIGENKDQSDRVQAVCNIFGPTDFTTVVQQAAKDTRVKNVFVFNSEKDPYSQLIGAPLETTDKSSAVSPVTYISSDDPPFLILHGTHDALVPYAQSVQFAKELEAEGLPVWLQTLPGAGHGGLVFVRPAVTRLMQDFFDKFLQGEDRDIVLVPGGDVTVPAPKAAN